MTTYADELATAIANGHMRPLRLLAVGEGAAAMTKKKPVRPAEFTSEAVRKALEAIRVRDSDWCAPTVRKPNTKPGMSPA